MIDIHDRREVEEALRESEEHYRALIEVSPQMVWMARRIQHLLQPMVVRLHGANKSRER
jgi:PAS domain-containing protein